MRRKSLCAVAAQLKWTFPVTPAEETSCMHNVEIVDTCGHCELIIFCHDHIAQNAEMAISFYVKRLA